MAFQDFHEVSEGLSGVDRHFRRGLVPEGFNRFLGFFGVSVAFM